MTGKNVMQLNEATLMQMVQHYFDDHLFKDGDAPTVKSVKARMDSQDTTLFEVVVEKGE